jgi:hypothetical protein
MLAVPLAAETNAMRDKNGIRRMLEVETESLDRGIHRLTTPLTALVLAVTLCAFAAEGPVWAADATVDSLAADTAVPWNPPHALAPREAWEQAVLLPGRIVSLPLVGLGAATRATTMWLEEKEFIPTGPQAPHVRRPRPISLHVPNLPEGASAGAAVELRNPGRGMIPTAAVRYTGTFRLYNSTLVTVSKGPALLQYGYDWRPQDPIYGVGLESSRDSLAKFAVQDEYVRGTFNWTWADSSARPRTSVQVWGGPRSRVTRTGRDDTRPSYEVLFPELAATTLDQHVEHLNYGAGFTGDFRHGQPHWNRGGFVRLLAERFDNPVQALALHSAQARGATFDRYTIEAETGFSFLRDRRTLRLYGRVIDDRIEDHPERFLFSDLARLGGRDGLLGYEPGRFRDLDALVTHAAYIFPLTRLFEFDLHSEWGAVYPDVWRDAAWRTLKSSYGFTLRLRTDQRMIGALGLDGSREGVRIRYALGDVE